MLTSDMIDKIAPALLNVQTVMPALHKTAANDFYKSRYAPLDKVMEVAQSACLANGITILQDVKDADDAGFTLTTTLLHTSGQWVAGGLRFPNPASERKDKEGVTHFGPPTPQGVGSAITYARRYSLSAILGLVADDDDDAESAMNRPSLGNLGGRAVLSSDTPSVPGNIGPAVKRVSTAATEYAGGVIPKTCPICNGRVWDNRQKKADGEYKPTYPDWSCAENTCKTDGRRTAGYLTKTPAGEPPPDDSQGEY
jgi:hypothetical protein